MLAQVRAVATAAGSADDFSGLQPGSFDCVLLNSVVQYFPDIDYLLRVLRGALQVVQPGGSVFIGDVRNLLLLEAFHTSVQLSQVSASLPSANCCSGSASNCNWRQNWSSPRPSSQGCADTFRRSVTLRCSPSEDGAATS